MKRGALCDAVVEACAVDVTYREVYSCKQVKILAKDGQFNHKPD